MNINRHTLLHYVLIILLMFAPLRGMAEIQQKHCDMSNDAADNGSMISGYSDMHEVMTLSTHDSKEPAITQHNCCCCDSNSCASDCDMGISVSLLLQQTSYTPNFVNDLAQVAEITGLIKRELSPPFRPPLVFHS